MLLVVLFSILLRVFSLPIRDRVTVSSSSASSEALRYGESCGPIISGSFLFQIRLLLSFLLGTGKRSVDPLAQVLLPSPPSVMNPVLLPVLSILQTIFRPRWLIRSTEVGI